MPKVLWECEDDGKRLRKLYMSFSLSLDGFFEGPNHDLSWNRVDDEFNKFAIEELSGTDLYLWGRRIYKLMEASWPKATAGPSTSRVDREIANLINTTPKIVFSRTLSAVRETKSWRNVKLVHELKPAEIRHLKAGSGKDISVGGPNLARSFMREGLIDEFRFIINPVAIGKGTPIFRELEEQLRLELVETRKFHSGNILACYRPIH